MNTILQICCFIILSTSLISCSTSRKIKKDIETANEIVEHSKDEGNYQSGDKSADQNYSLLDAISIINASKSSVAILLKDSILQICNNLDQNISNAMDLIANSHGLDQNGILKNRQSSKYVNEIFIKGGLADNLKDSIDQTVTSLSQQYLKFCQDISTLKLPLKSTKSVISNNETWESKYFQNMPAIALLPILRAYRRDIHDSKRYLLNLLIGKLKENG